MAPPNSSRSATRVKAAQFQGDERDIVFPLWLTAPDDGQLRFLGAGARDLFKKRYNVAVSRARNQLWVVHSLDPEAHLQPNDLRRRLIAHARDPYALLHAIEEQGRRTDSGFDIGRFGRAGYRVRTQWPGAGLTSWSEGQKRRPPWRMGSAGIHGSSCNTTSNAKPPSNALAGSSSASAAVSFSATPIQRWPQSSRNSKILELSRGAWSLHQTPTTTILW